MSKIIKLTPECFDEIRKDFEETLSKAKVADGKISYTKTFATIIRKAELHFTEVAWSKMQALIREFDKEVAWHGVAYRDSDEGKDNYYISDILVYPQEVTGATVNTDQEKYQMWLMGHEDEVFNNIRMQGHSHVNMSTSPSGVDLTHQEKILGQLDNDMFYIFVIWNKRNEKTIKIYDLKKNVLFETSDVTVIVDADENGIERFIKDAKGMVKDKVYTPAPKVNSGYGYSGYSGYGYSGYNSGISVHQGGKSATTESKKEEKTTTDLVKSDDKSGKKSGKKKGKRRDKKKSNTIVSNACDAQTSLRDEEDELYRYGYGYGYGGWDD